MYPFQIAAEPSTDLGLSIVIPCFNEPDVGRTLVSLSLCDPPGCDVEILVVVNSPSGATRPARENNARALRQIADAAKSNSREWLRCYGLLHDELPVRRAGVGLARKIGMDEAVGRFARTRRCDGMIVSLDADCRVDRDFLYQLRREFLTHERCSGLSIYFEHPVSTDGGGRIESAMVNYELHLRYYVFGQRMAGFPYAFHTIGSAMACRGATYAGQGGMNRRKGGEDFYFIQKLIALGGYRALNSTTVYPDVRLSERVPFGTGPAIRKALEEPKELATFAPEVFRDLESFCRAVVDTRPEDLEKAASGLPKPLKRFLDQNDFAGRLHEIERNVSGPRAFRKRLFRWFNAFRFLKFAQFASREHYPRIPVARAARQLAERAGCIDMCEPADPAFLLSRYRQLDKQSGPNEIFKDLF